MKQLISILVGVATAVWIFILTAKLINWVSSVIHDHDLRIFLKIGLWIVGIGWTATVAIFLGYIAGSFLNAVWPDKTKKKTEKILIKKRKVV